MYLVKDGFSRFPRYSTWLGRILLSPSDACSVLDQVPPIQLKCITIHHSHSVSFVGHVCKDRHSKAAEGVLARVSVALLAGMSP